MTMEATTTKFNWKTLNEEHSFIDYEIGGKTNRFDLITYPDGEFELYCIEDGLYIPFGAKDENEAREIAEGIILFGEAVAGEFNQSAKTSPVEWTQDEDGNLSFYHSIGKDLLNFEVFNGLKWNDWTVYGDCLEISFRGHRDQMVRTVGDMVKFWEMCAG